MAKNLLILITEYKAKKAQEKAIKNEIESVKKEILPLLNGQDEVICGQYMVRNKEVKTKRIDTDRLFAEHPEINPADYTEYTVSTRFTV